MSELVDEVAAAICEVHRPYLGSSPNPSLYKFMARAAIKAMAQGLYQSLIDGAA